jgi:predicted ABC-type ATPase
MIAGPNGSGKSTLIEMLRPAISLGVYINADEIEERLKKKSVLHFEDFSIQVSQNSFFSFVKKKSTIGSPDFKANIFSATNINNNLLSIDKSIVNSYFASLIADFIRHQLLSKSESFSFETVMSHPSKIKMVEAANKKNYQTYLYFISTNNPLINYGRIKGRVEKGGHNVSKQKIEERYKKSLQLLHSAIKISYRSYIFDNTVSLTLLAEYKQGILQKQYAPFSEWFKNLQKKDF